MDPWVELAKQGPMVFFFGMAIYFLWKKLGAAEEEIRELNKEWRKFVIAASGLEESREQ